MDFFFSTLFCFFFFFKQKTAYEMRISDWSSDVCSSDLNIVAGSLDDYGTEDGILLGARLARQFGVTAGDRITLLSPSGTTTVMGTVPRMKTYRIAGLFEVGMAVYDEGFLYVPLQAAQLFFRLPGSVPAVGIGRASGRERVCQSAWIR